MNVRKVLILLPRQLGDIIVTTPLATILKKQFPTAQVHWWSHPMGHLILDQNPFIDEIKCYPIWNKKIFLEIKRSYFFIFIAWLKFLYRSIMFSINIRKEHYDVVVDAINYPRSTLQSIISGAKIRISFRSGEPRDIFYSHLINRTLIDSGYLAHTKWHLLAPLGMTEQNIFTLQQKQENNLNILDPVLIVTTDNETKILKWILSQNLNNFCVITPTQRKSIRIWPLEKFIELAIELIIKYKIKIVWLRGPGEEEYIQKAHIGLKQKLQEIGLNEDFSLVPPMFSLKEVCALAKHSIGWIGHSSGMSHAATANHIKTIEIFGPTPSVNWCHPDTKMHRPVQRKTGCIACSLAKCKLNHRECLEDLCVKDVLISVEDLFFRKDS